MQEVKDLTIKETQKMVEEGVKIIDIRTPNEWSETGVIKESYKLMFFDPMGGYDEKKWLNDLSEIIFSKDEPFILICRKGNRTREVGNFLLNQVGYKNIYHTKEGIIGWIEEGCRVVKNR